MSNVTRMFARWPVRPNWVFADQIVVSGSKFAAGVLVARFLGPDLFGTFVLMQMAQLYANACQGALVISPMLVGAPRLEATQRDNYLSCKFASQIILSVLLALSIAVLAFVWRVVSQHANPELTRPCNLVGFMAALVACQFQDWQRRCFFATGRSRDACVGDMLSYVPLVVLIGVVGLSGRLSISLTFWIITLSSASSFCTGYAANRVRPDFRGGFDALRREWKASRDYLLSYQVMWAGTQGALLIGTAFLDQYAIGGIRATQNVVGPFTALLQALENVIPVSAARRFSTSGIKGVVFYMRTTTLCGTLVLVPVVVGTALLGEPLTRLLYGARYVAFAPLVGWQAVYMLSQFYVHQFYYFFSAVSETRSIFVCSCVVATVSTSMTLLCARRFHETGVVAALLCGTLAGLGCALPLAATFLRQHQNARLVPAREPT
jgi:O-antigen/teichoic acid export membrane protein